MSVVSSAMTQGLFTMATRASVQNSPWYESRGIVSIAELASCLILCVVIAGLGCAVRADVPVIVEPLIEAGSPMIPDPDPATTVVPCGKRDHIVLLTDAGVLEFDVPRPCNPIKYRELGDPQP